MTGAPANPVRKKRNAKTKDQLKHMMPSLVFDVKGIAKLLGVSLETVYTYKRQGMPTTKERPPQFENDDSLFFDAPTCVKWYADNIGTLTILEDDDSTIVELKRRKLSLEVAKAEVELAKLSGNLVDVDFVISAVCEEYVNVKQQLRAIPQRVTPIIIGEASEAAIKKIIADEIDVALDGLSKNILERAGEAADWDDEGEAGIEASAEDDHLPMGGCEAADNGW